MAWFRRSTYRWIAIVYLVIIAGQATGFSACQHPPQEIRISRGQKITVVYWVGQNALDDGKIEGKFASEVPSTSSASEVTSTEEGSSASPPEVVSEEVTQQHAASSDAPVSFHHPSAEVSTEANLQTLATEPATLSGTDSPQSQSTEAPSTALPSTSPVPALNSNALNEDALRAETPEKGPQEVGISGRNSTSEEEASTPKSTTLGVVPEASTVPSEADITSAQSENIDVKTASTTVHDLEPRAEQEGVTSEVEYWSTTPAPQVPEDDTQSSLEEKSAAEVTTEDVRSQKSEDKTENAPDASTAGGQGTSPSTESLEESTSGSEKTLLAEDSRIPKLDETAGLSTEGPVEVTPEEEPGSTSTTAITENSKRAKLDEDVTPLWTETPVDVTTGEIAEENVANETSAKELGPKSSGGAANETIAEVSLELSAEAIGNVSEVTVAGRQPEDELFTVANDTRNASSRFSDVEQTTESGTGAELQNSTRGIEGRLENDNENINSSSSSPVSLDVRAAFDAETLSPIENGTESAEIVSEASSPPSILETITSTFKNLFSTIAPGTATTVVQTATSTEETLEGREQNTNVSAEIANLESGNQDLSSNETFKGRGQDSNVTLEIADNGDGEKEPTEKALDRIVQGSNVTSGSGDDQQQDLTTETLEGRERGSNVTSDFGDRHQQEATTETLRGREQGSNATSGSGDSQQRDFTTETFSGREQESNFTSGSGDSEEQNLTTESLVGRERISNLTLGSGDSDQELTTATVKETEQGSNITSEILKLEGKEQNTANETLEGRENDTKNITLDVNSPDNDTTTSTPDIVFRNTTTDAEVTIDPRSAINVTAEELSITTELAEDVSETSAKVSEPPISTGELDNVMEVVFNSQRVVTEASPGTEYDESELQVGELDDPENPDAPPLDIFIPIGQPAAAEDSEGNGSTEEARKLAGYPMDNFESFMHHNAPDLLRIPVDESQYEKEARKKEFLKPITYSKDRTKPIHIRPSIYNSRNPFPPPYLMQFPARRSDNVPHPFSGYLVPEGAGPPLLVDDLQPQASSSGPFYRPYYNVDPMLLPPESPVHYVSVMNPPDGVLPIRSLRMSPAQRGGASLPRAKREIDPNATNCQWIFKSDPGVPLLLTFKSFSTPETPDCEDHYIAVERESNGFQSRWCGVSGERPGHASFARSEISLNLYSNGDGSFPTGFSVEVQALDLKLLRKYAEVRRIIKHQ